MARQLAPGGNIVVQHRRGAPMLKVSFVNGQGFNTSVRGEFARTECPQVGRQLRA